MQEYALRAKGLTKTYKAVGPTAAKQALKGIDLAVPRGSIFGLLGPNGAGKSTFINILAGMVVKSGGAAEIWGFDIEQNPRQARASIGIVPQELSIDPFFTPGEIMDLQAGMYGVPKSQRRTLEILTAMGLDDKLDAYARTLSGGMRRRLLVAKALVHNPPVLVLDEPTAGVDIELRRQLWDYVLELNKAGVTIVLTTHYLEEAEELCDTIAIIDQGELRACDSTQNLLSQIDNKTLLVRPASPLATAPSLDGLDAKLTEDGRLAVTYNPGLIPAGAVIAQLNENGVDIADLDTRGAELENVFLKLTS
ncbi:MAG: Daunorubicin/doxorubicin resistance ATP-binding protein DrrA [Alphaproteobacteria bacterium]|nr:MAG: Daunorubicin/doxorubicin resistance ATP-binding protein DrrA [Alphaproteobacteria bacterium]